MNLIDTTFECVGGALVCTSRLRSLTTCSLLALACPGVVHGDREVCGLRESELIAGVPGLDERRTSSEKDRGVPPPPDHPARHFD